MAKRTVRPCRACARIAAQKVCRDETSMPVVAEQPDRAGVGGAQPQQQIEGGGLPRAVGPEQRDGLALVQREVQVATARTLP